MLVSDPKNPLFADIPTDWLITSPTPAYTSALLALYVELASYPAIASGIASRATSPAPNDWRRSLYVEIACRLLANGEAEKAKMEHGSTDRLSALLGDRQIECKPAKSAAPH